jgi:hypothetical protein
MDERVDGVTSFVSAKKAVMLSECVSEPSKCATQVVGCVPVVMEMDLDFAHAGGADLRELIEVFRTVLFGRIKERVLNWSTVRIFE